MIGLLFGRGEPCQANHESDQDSSGQSYIKTYGGQFLKAGGLAIPAGSGSGTGGSSGSGGGSGGGTATGGGAQTTVPSSTALVSPTAVTTGGTVTVTATVTNGSTALNAGFIIVELGGPAGTRLAQKDCTGVSLAAGAKTQCSLSWVTTSSGTHTVKVGVFNSSWGLLHWNDTAASFNVAAAPPAYLYSFEGTTEGWSTSGAVLSPATVSTARASQGTRSLAATLTGTAGRQNIAVASPPLRAGQVVSMQVWVPGGSGLTSLQPYILEGATANWRYTGTWTAASALTANAWNTLTVQVPADATTPAQLGLEVTATSGAASTLYVDNVR